MFMKAILHNKEDDLEFLLKCLVEELNDNLLLKQEEDEQEEDEQEEEDDRDFGSVKGDRKKARKEERDDSDPDAPKAKDPMSVKEQLKAQRELYGFVKFNEVKFTAEEIVKMYGDLLKFYNIWEGKFESDITLAQQIDPSKLAEFQRKELIRRTKKAKKQLVRLKKRMPEIRELVAKARKEIDKKDEVYTKLMRDYKAGKDLEFKSSLEEVTISNAQIKRAILESEQTSSKVRRELLEQQKKLMERWDNLGYKKSIEKYKTNSEYEKEINEGLKQLDEVIAAGNSLFDSVEHKVSFKEVLSHTDNDIVRDLEKLIESPQVKQVLQEKLFKDIFRLQGKEDEVELDEEGNLKNAEKLIARNFDTVTSGRKLELYLRVAGVIQQELSNTFSKVKLDRSPRKPQEISMAKIRKLTERLGKLSKLLNKVKKKAITTKQGLKGKGTKADAQALGYKDLSEMDKNLTVSPSRTTVSFYKGLASSIKKFEREVKKRKSRERRAAIAKKYFGKYDKHTLIFALDLMFGRVRKGGESKRTFEKITKEFKEVREKIEKLEQEIKEIHKEKPEDEPMKQAKRIKLKRRKDEKSKLLDKLSRIEDEARIFSQAIGVLENQDIKPKRKVGQKSPVDDKALRQELDRKYTVIESLVRQQEKLERQLSEFPTLEEFKESNEKMKPKEAEAEYKKQKKGLEERLKRAKASVKRSKETDIKKGSFEQAVDKDDAYRLYDIDKNGKIVERLLPMDEGTFDVIKNSIVDIRKRLAESNKVDKDLGFLGTESLRKILYRALKDLDSLPNIDLSPEGQDKRKEVEKLVGKLEKESAKLDKIEDKLEKALPDSILYKLDDIAEEMKEDLYYFFGKFFGEFIEQVELNTINYNIEKEKLDIDESKFEGVIGISESKPKETKKKIKIEGKYNKKIGKQLALFPILGNTLGIEDEPLGEVVEEYKQGMKAIIDSVKELEKEKKMAERQKRAESAVENLKWFEKQDGKLKEVFANAKVRAEDLEKAFREIMTLVDKLAKYQKKFAQLTIDAKEEPSSEAMKEWLKRNPIDAKEALGLADKKENKDFTDYLEDGIIEDASDFDKAVELEIRRNLSSFDKNIKKRKKEYRNEGKYSTKRGSGLPIFKFALEGGKKPSWFKYAKDTPYVKLMNKKQKEKLQSILEGRGEQTAITEDSKVEQADKSKKADFEKLLAEQKKKIATMLKELTKEVGMYIRVKRPVEGSLEDVIEYFEEAKETLLGKDYILTLDAENYKKLRSIDLEKQLDEIEKEGDLAKLEEDLKEKVKDKKITKEQMKERLEDKEKQLENTAIKRESRKLRDVVESVYQFINKPTARLRRGKGHDDTTTLSREKESQRMDDAIRKKLEEYLDELLRGMIDEETGERRGQMLSPQARPDTTGKDARIEAREKIVKAFNDDLEKFFSLESTVLNMDDLKKAFYDTKNMNKLLTEFPQQRPRPKAIKRKGDKYDITRAFLLKKTILGKDEPYFTDETEVNLIKDLLPAIQTYQKTLDKLTGDKLDKIFKEKIFDLGEE